MSILNASKRFPRILQTPIWLSEYCTLNRDSSKKTTLFHSCIQLYFSVHHSKSLSVCCIVSGSGRYGHGADRSCCYKCRRTVESETGNSENMYISWLMVHEFLILFCRAVLTIFLPPRSLIIRGHSYPACRSYVPQPPNDFIIRINE